MPVDPHHVRWLLKDKYGWSDTRIQAALQKGLPREVGDDLRRLEEGEPLQYVIGWVQFLDLKIDLSFRPLIPRPETEYWVGKVIEEWQQAGSAPKKLLDLCCGSGCIGLSVLKEFPESVVTCSDISEAAIEQTQKNLEINALPQLHCTLLKSDLFSAVTGTFDVILTNPPYVNFAGDFGVEVLYEPSQAIFAQKNGFELIEKIIFEAKKYLNSGGELVMECGAGQESAVEKMARSAGWSEVEMSADQYGVTRWCRLR